MKFLFASDLHASKKHLYSMFQIAEEEHVDGIIIGGDIIPHLLPVTKCLIDNQADYLKKRLIPAIKDFKAKHAISIYLDFGNDDLIYNRSILERYDGTLFHLVHNKRHKLTEEVDILGYMCVPPTPFILKDWEKPDTAERPYAKGNRIKVQGFVSKNGFLKEATLNLKTDDTIEKDLERLSQKILRPFIFVSHSPPYNTFLDVINEGINVGSVSIRKFIERWSEEKLLITSLHGHIHESPARSGRIYTKIKNCLCFNPGQGNGRGAAFKYVIFELEGTEITF